MKLNFKPFHDLVRNYTTENTRRRYADSEIREIEVGKNYVQAKVKGTRIYIVEIHFSPEKVTQASCTCAFDYGGYCKHIVHVLVNADELLSESGHEISVYPKEESLPSNYLQKEGNTFIVAKKSFSELSEKKLNRISGLLTNKSNRTPDLEITTAKFDVHHLTMLLTEGLYYDKEEYAIDILQTEGSLKLQCSCDNKTGKICRHLHFSLSEMLKNSLLQLSFDLEERHRILAQKAYEKGWENITDLNNFFSITLLNRRIYIQPKVKILAYTDKDKDQLRQNLLPDFQLPVETQTKDFVVVEEAYYGGVVKFCLMKAPLAKSGAIKSPIEKADIHNKVRNAQTREESLFYLALIGGSDHKTGIDDCRDIIKNPLKLDFYAYKPGWYSEKITPQKLTALDVRESAPEIKIMVKESGDFYVLTCLVRLDNLNVTSKDIEVSGSLLLHKKTLFGLSNEAEIKVLRFFHENDHQIYLQRNQLTSFREEFLDKLENAVTVSYSFIKPAPKAMIQKESLDVVSRHFIYLTELGDFVLITPALSYGDVEVAVLSRKTPYTSAPDGSLYSIERKQDVEDRFIRNVQARHPDFDKIPQTDYFYLHKKKFMDEGWFLRAFEAWRAENYTILGFNTLKNNRYSQYTIQVRTSVQSGIDWFDISADVSFGRQKVSLKQIQKSILNKTRFIELADGTQGILPQEWIDRFAHYFRVGEIKNDVIRTHKSNFQLIDQLFEQEVLSREVQHEVQQYKEKLANFHSISHVKVPEKLKAKLRDYQKEGLNWLNFLDEFGFGGCLADDMGLGKTVQVIAYFLAQHEKGNTETNLVVVPTSLLFNWQRELDKFAPHLRYFVLYGLNRKTEQLVINDYHVILATYGTLLSDISILKKQAFNIIVLDESQAIKNPESKRYKSVRLLHGRQRLVLTGTPVENNTFDLYAQLSFALPGLLGNAKHFADSYSTPIDKFQDSDRAQELQRKIHPFILRRTKTQVAKELPDKTEMVVYCEMGTEQKRVYDLYKTEFQKYLSGLEDSELHSSTMHILQGLTKLRQICNSPALLADDEYYGDRSAKLDELMEQIGKLKDRHKILVFSQFTGMLDLVKECLEAENVAYAYLTGKTKNREEQVTLFQEDENVRVFLISLKAGGTGLNLTQAEYVFLIDPWWNPAVENQAIDRAYRIGQQNKVVAVRFITPDSIEEKIMLLQQRKRQLAEDLIRTDGSILKQLRKEDLMGLI